MNNDDTHPNDASMKPEIMSFSMFLAYIQIVDLIYDKNNKINNISILCKRV